MSTEEWPEDGWPARDFDEEARDYLLVEARQRVQEQLSLIRSQDVKTAALFTTSIGVFTLSGLLGSLRVEATTEAVLTLIAFFGSLVVWFFLGLAYWTREIGSGLDVEVVRLHYRRASRRELQEITLESLVEGFILNQKTIRSKEQWLRKSFFAVAAQLLLLFAAIIASAIADPADPADPSLQVPPVTDNAPSSAILVDGER